MPTRLFLETYVLVTDLAVIAILLLGSASVLSRTTTAPSAFRTWIALLAILLAWYGLSSYLAVHDVFRASRAVKIPALPFAVFLPIIAGLWVLSRLPIITRVLDATPLSWLVGVQVYRVVGVIFLILLGAGRLPREFALPAGTGDVIVGLVALPVAWAARSGSRRALMAAYAWNGLGILDFIVAIATGFLSSPGRIQLLALDHPNLIASAYPLVMIPVFLVPLSSILHGLCLWKIRRLSRAAVMKPHSSTPVPAPASTFGMTPMGTVPLESPSTVGIRS